MGNPIPRTCRDGRDGMDSNKGRRGDKGVRYTEVNWVHGERDGHHAEEEQEEKFT